MHTSLAGSICKGILKRFNVKAHGILYTAVAILCLLVTLIESFISIIDNDYFLW